MNVPVGIACTKGAMRDANELHVLNWYNSLLPAGANTRHRLLSEPALNLWQGILLCSIKRLRDFRVQGGSDRE